MKINSFRGDRTDVSAKKEALILILRLLCEHHYSYCSKLAFRSKAWLNIVLMEKNMNVIFRMNYSFIYSAMGITMWNGKHYKPSSTYLFTKHLYQPYPISIKRMKLCRKLQRFHAENSTPTNIKKRVAYFWSRLARTCATPNPRTF